MNIKLVFASTAAILNIGLIFFVSLRNRRHVTYQTFILITFCLLMWNLRVVISSLITEQPAHTFYDLALNGIFFPVVTVCLYFLPAAALHFTISYIQTHAKPMTYLLHGGYIMAAFLSLIYLTNVLPSRAYAYILEFYMIPLFVCSLFIIGMAYLRSSRPLERSRLGLLFIAGSIGVAGALIEDIMPALGYTALGIGNAANAVYSLLVAISLFRHRLFDVNLRVRQLTGFVLTLIILSILSLLFSRLLHLSDVAPYGYIFVIVVSILLFGRKIMVFIENILFKKLKLTAEPAADINHTLGESKNTRNLCYLITELIHTHMNIDDVCIYLYSEVSHTYRLIWKTPLLKDVQEVIISSNPLVHWFRRQKQSEPFVHDEIMHRLRFSNISRTDNDIMCSTLKAIETTGFETSVPMMFKETLEGIIFLGMKNNNRPLTTSDINTMKLITHSSTVWLQRFKMLERIRHLEQYATLGEMAAYIAHEVKNPLAIIRSSAQLIDDKNHRKSTAIIMNECDRLNRVISQLLSLAKTSCACPAPLDVHKELTAYIEEISKHREFSKVVISLNSECNSYIIKCDRDHFKHIIMNIMFNAAEALNGHGKIDVSVCDHQNRRLRLVIKDNGPGIPQEKLEKIYEPFYTTKPGGTGLGLPITQKLLNLNNASMDILSNTESGLTVILDFPYWKE